MQIATMRCHRISEDRVRNVARVRRVLGHTQVAGDFVSTAAVLAVGGHPDSRLVSRTHECVVHQYDFLSFHPQWRVSREILYLLK
jgi:hypothetical protein